MATSRLCSIPDCGKPHKGLGYCQTHYIRFTKCGDALGGGPYPAPKGTLPDWLASAERFEGDECLLWPFRSVYHDGYGSVKVDGKMHRSHRLICELVHGNPPTQKHAAAHSCGVRLCCNPKHLRWATTKENLADMVEHGTSRRGTEMPGAKLNEADIKLIRQLKGNLSYPKIAARFGVRPDTIRSIMQGRTWSWLA